LFPARFFDPGGQGIYVVDSLRKWGKIKTAMLKIALLKLAIAALSGVIILYAL
jgi:hypothetical protein